MKCTACGKPLTKAEEEAGNLVSKAKEKAGDRYCTACLREM